MRIEIWSDIVCPWCYLGKRRFEQALAGFEQADEVQVRYRSFELDPSFPADRPEPVAEVLAAKYGMSAAQARQAEADLAARAAQDGLPFTADRVMGNTFDAHRLMHLAADHELGDRLLTEFYQAYFGAGRPVFTAADLVPVSAAAGLDPAEAARVLADGSYAAAVREDEAQARELGITGVPFFVIDRRFGLSGAQPAQTIAQALETAWQRRSESLAG
ncbi:MAG: DsbA family oxidoreductase [Streptosporangiaceae bacterium]